MILPRCESILDVTERNSVIEGLPPFQEETRRRLKEQLMALAVAAAKACRMISTIGT